ncbi:MAG: NUDIX hydrolase [Gammaproteobacteria bacterium]
MTNKQVHPRLNDNGAPVSIHRPSSETPLTAFADSQQIAVVLPDGKTPTALHGIAFTKWPSAPRCLAAWVHVDGQTKIEEPPMVPVKGKKLSAGVVIVEPDQRIWVVAPTNAFGGYQVTFPKGTCDRGLSLQATAIKEAFEESGLKVEIISWIGDFERTTSVTRYYFAHRVGGTPAAMGWESQAVMLVPKLRLPEVLNHANDHALYKAINEKYKRY